MFAVATQTSIGLFILFLSVLIAVVFGLVNIRQGRKEVGSEIELAPNRKPYLRDDELEGSKLDRTLTFGLIGIFVLGIGLPLYWLQEPSRQEGAAQRISNEFIGRGKHMFAPTEEGGYNCAFCHGPDGGGGATDFTITDAEGRFVKAVSWRGPALNNVYLRYDRSEVRYILEYGRLATPMPAWGAKGGGPLTEQQLQNLMDYIQTLQLGWNDGKVGPLTEEDLGRAPTKAESKQLKPEERAAILSQEAVKKELATAMEARDPVCVDALRQKKRDSLSGDELKNFDPTTVDTDSCPKQWKSEGEAMFNLGYTSGFAGGAYSCGRCHTPGWSYGEAGDPASRALGPNLVGIQNQFPGDMLGLTQMTDFVCNGSSLGARYGQYGQGTGRMPGHCVWPGWTPDTEAGEVGIESRDAGTPEQGGMYTREQVEQIVEYVRSLDK